MDYPETKKVDTSDVYFGLEVKDPYRWLEDENSKATEQWIEAQNEVTFDYLEQIPFRNKVNSRLRELYDYERIGEAQKVAGYYYYLKNNGLQEHSVLYRKEGKTGEEETLLDPNKLSEDLTVALANYKISPDGNYIAYSLSKSGSDWQEIFVLDLKTGDKLSDHIKNVKFSDVEWYKDGFYYTRFEAPGEEERLTSVNNESAVFYHQLETDQSKDKKIYASEANGRYYDIDVTGNDKSYLIIYEAKGTSGVHLFAKDIQDDHKTILALESGFEYEYKVITCINETLYIKTNYQAPKYKLVKVDLGSSTTEDWEDIIAEQNGVLEDCAWTGKSFFCIYQENVENLLYRKTLLDSNMQQIDLPSNGSIDDLSANKAGQEVLFTYTSYISPGTIYSYSESSDQLETFFEPELDYDIDHYVSEKITYRSKDGTEVPMYIVRNKNIQKNGKNPTLLYGYGGFSITQLPAFSPNIIYWLEAGGIYVNAHIRGGGEFGESWHKAGTKLNKQNVFDDFIAAAEYLIEENYTSSEKLAIYGGSNGGLLVGAVTNQRPELFEVAVPAVGVMDMLRYHKFTIGWAWATDYGTSEDSAHFKNLYSYSPLHNISAEKNYPSVMAVTADHDDRVVPAHTFKYIATIQEKYQGKNPILVRIQTNAGHGANLPISMKIEEKADIYSFMLYELDHSVN